MWLNSCFSPPAPIGPGQAYDDDNEYYDANSSPNCNPNYTTCTASTASSLLALLRSLQAGGANGVGVVEECLRGAAASEAIASELEINFVYVGGDDV